MKDHIAIIEPFPNKQNILSRVISLGSNIRILEQFLEAYFQEGSFGKRSL